MTPLVLKTRYSWQVLYFNVIIPVTKDHLSWETIFEWPMRWAFRTGSTVVIGSAVNQILTCDNMYNISCINLSFINSEYQFSRLKIGGYLSMVDKFMIHTKSCIFVFNGNLSSFDHAIIAFDNSIFYCVNFGLCNSVKFLDNELNIEWDLEYMLLISCKGCFNQSILHVFLQK